MNKKILFLGMSFLTTASFASDQVTQDDLTKSKQEMVQENLIAPLEVQCKDLEPKVENPYNKTIWGFNPSRDMPGLVFMTTNKVYLSCVYESKAQNNAGKNIIPAKPPFKVGLKYQF